MNDDTYRQFNGLTAAEAERLALLSEEMGEVQQIIGKILRHGYESNWNDGPTNRAELNKEIGDVWVIFDMMERSGDIDEEVIDKRIIYKWKKIQEFLHHNDHLFEESSEEENVQG